MKILITGDRDWYCLLEAERFLANLLSRHDHLTLIHGDARGVDTAFKHACLANKNNVTVIACPADWFLGRHAGPMRNQRMVDMKPDETHAWHDRFVTSKGTNDCVRRSVMAVIPTYLHTSDGSVKQVVIVGDRPAVLKLNEVYPHGLAGTGTTT